MAQRERFVQKIGPRTRVSAETAMIDRFELNVGGWQADGTRPELAARFGNLSAWQVETGQGTVTNVFQDAQLSPDRSRYYLTIMRSGRGPDRNQVRPLVSGQLIVNLLSSGAVRPDYPVRCSFSVQGSWNLTRFLQAHDFPPRMTASSARPTSYFPMAIEPRSDWWRTELPLVPNDNVIIGKGVRYAHALSRPAEDHLRDYVGGTPGALVNQLILSEILPEPTRENEFDERDELRYDPAEYRLGDIELYWEFDHKTPIAFVDTLTHYLPRVAKRMRVTRKHLNRIEREVSLQSQSATIFLTRNRQVKVYAKTNRRVRFEVTFPDGYRSTSHRRSTFDTLEQLIAAVRNLKTEAADTLNDVLDGLWHWVEPHKLDATPEQLRAAVVAAAEDPFIATTLLHMLAKRGRIALVPGDPLRPTVHRLSKSSRPVLKTLRSDRNIFVVERNFEFARRNLKRV